MRKIEIIAECGINHNGDMELAKQMIREAKACGADVAKFQLYDPEKRVDINEHPYKEILLKSKLTKRQLYDLKDECDKVKIEFMCSVFDVERVGWLEQVGVKRYKIASKSIYDEKLLEAVFKTEKDIIISTGMVDERGLPIDINNHWACADGYIKLLYCISNYPTELKDININELLIHNGFSDHTIGITAAVVAMSLGARIIEKHFTLDRSMEGPDHILSAEPNELKLLCNMRDDIERILY